MNELSVIYRNPYFEERAWWDQQYIKSYVNLLSLFSKDDRIIDTMISREAIYRCCGNIKSIIKAFDEMVAKEKIAAILPQYSCWIIDGKEWLDIKDNSALELIAKYIFNNDIAALYERFLNVNTKTFSIKVKRIVKRLIKPFIERYRDGLVKFKF